MTIIPTCSISFSKFQTTNSKLTRSNYQLNENIFLPPKFSKSLAEFGVMEARVLIAQSPPGSLSPNHKCVHRPFDVGLAFVQSENGNSIFKMKITSLVQSGTQGVLLVRVKCKLNKYTVSYSKTNLNWTIFISKLKWFWKVLFPWR